MCFHFRKGLERPGARRCPVLLVSDLTLWDSQNKMCQWIPRMAWFPKRILELGSRRIE